MSCILRVAGEKLDINELLDVEWEPEVYWVKGEPRLQSRPNGEKHLTSGANYCISDADFDEFTLQKEEVIKYLYENEEKIKAIQNLSAHEGAYLDFAIEQRDVAVQCDSFPPELIKLAGALGLGIEISQYPPYDDEDL